MKLFSKIRDMGIFVPIISRELSPMSFYILFTHVLGVQGLFFLVMGHVPWQHVIFVISVGIMGFLGEAAGAHRLWAHRTYKAKLPLRILLATLFSFGGHGSIIFWAQDHRLHHKFAETDTDPYNINRGLLFAQIGWLVLKRHPKVVEKMGTLDFSDLWGDPVLAVQHYFYVLFELVLCQLLPVWLPHHFWGVPLYTCWCVNYLRFVLFFHIAGLGNSVAHSWTLKPYEKRSSSADVTWLSLLLLGEGWHNFHHAFPGDYRSTDVGPYAFNFSTIFIELMAKIGWAYDLKTVPDHVIKERAGRTGDGSWHPIEQCFK